MSETDSIYSLHNAYGLLDLTIEVVNRMEKDSKKKLYNFYNFKFVCKSTVIWLTG